MNESCSRYTSWESDGRTWIFFTREDLDSSQMAYSWTLGMMDWQKQRRKELWTSTKLRRQPSLSDISQRGRKELRPLTKRKSLSTCRTFNKLSNCGCTESQTVLLGH